MLYKRFQLLHAISNQLKRIIKTTNDSCTNIVCLDHHLVRNNRIVALEKLHSKEIYSYDFSKHEYTYIKTIF